MEIEALVTLVMLFSIFGGIFCLRPHKSKAPKRNTTSHRNGYSRGFGR